MIYLRSLSRIGQADKTLWLFCFLRVICRAITAAGRFIVEISLRVRWLKRLTPARLMVTVNVSDRRFDVAIRYSSISETPEIYRAHQSTASSASK